MLKFLANQARYKENLAHPSKRFLAYMIDVLLVNLMRYILYIIFYNIWYYKSLDLAKIEYFNLIKQGQYDMNSYQDFWRYFFTHNILYDTLFIGAVIMICGALYWIIMPITKKQASFGKLILGLKIVGITKKRLILSHSIARYVVGLLPWLLHIFVLFCMITSNIGLLLFTMLLISLWYEPSFFRPSRKSIHDIICRTRVYNKK